MRLRPAMNLATSGRRSTAAFDCTGCGFAECSLHSATKSLRSDVYHLPIARVQCFALHTLFTRRIRRRLRKRKTQHNQHANKYTSGSSSSDSLPYVISSSNWKIAGRSLATKRERCGAAAFRGSACRLGLAGVCPGRLRVSEAIEARTVAARSMKQRQWQWCG